MEDGSKRVSSADRPRRPPRLSSRVRDPGEAEGAVGEPAAPPARRLARREALLAGGATVTTTLGLGASGGGVLRASTAARAGVAAVAAPEVPAYLSRSDLRLPGLAVMRRSVRPPPDCCCSRPMPYKTLRIRRRPEP